MKKGCGCLMGCALAFLLFIAVGKGMSNAEDERIKNTPLYELTDYVESLAGEQIKKQLRDPESYQFVDMREQSTSKQGEKLFIVTYRAKNGFGGYNIGKALFSCNSENLYLITNED